MKPKDIVVFNDVPVLIEFADCCDTCINSDIGTGYSGRRSNGWCKVRKCLINRETICGKYERHEIKINRMIAGAKGQAKWYREDSK